MVRELGEKSISSRSRSRCAGQPMLVRLYDFADNGGRIDAPVYEYLIKIVPCAFPILLFDSSWIVSLVVIFGYKFRYLRFNFSAQQGSNMGKGGGGVYLNESLFAGGHLFPLCLCLLDWDAKEPGCMLLCYLVY